MSKLCFLIKEDLKSHGGSGFLRIVLTILFNTSFRLVLNYRLGRFLHKNRNPSYSILILFLKRRQLHRYSSDISYQSDIGRRIHFPHPIGIVIGEGVKIEDDVMIWQGVTLGSHGKANETDKSYPVIRSKVKLFTRCKVLGPIEVGTGARVGASALVVKDVPSQCVAIGIPAISKPLQLKNGYAT